MRGPIRRRTLRRRAQRRIRRRTRRLMLGTTAILLLGGTVAAVKLQRKDIERIEKDTGKSADDLTETELLAAMKKLGIQKLELTDEDQAAIDQADEEGGE
jgi:hypothetical protein